MNVIRSRSKRTDRVFSKAKHGMQILAEALLDSGVKGAQNCSRTTTVSLHSRHSSLAIPKIIRIVHITAGIFACYLSLDAKATGVIDNSLSDPGNVDSGCFSVVAQDDQGWRHSSSFSHTVNSSETPFIQFLSLNDIHSGSNQLGNLGGLL
jgi:hypothetical protein